METVKRFGPEYFNHCLLTKLEDVPLSSHPFDETGVVRIAFDEKGDRESQSVYDFFDRAEGIANALKGRVRSFLFRMELNENYLRDHIADAESLLTQFEKLKQSKQKADQVLKDLQGKLAYYDCSKEAVISADIVTNYATATKVLAYLNERSAKIENEYLYCAHPSCVNFEPRESSRG